MVLKKLLFDKESRDEMRKKIPVSYAIVGMYVDGKIIIDVDPLKWKDASPSKKWYVLYHELGHDYLNLKHGVGGKMMFNYVDRDYSWGEFYEDKKYMFESYKQLKTNN